ncbi:MAG: PEP-CTERM sorting domain-containing protein, partial [Kiritimatiellales bacterium]
SASVLTFDFRGNGGAFDFEATTGEITTNGITMSFAAIDPEDAGAILNAATYFGVNSNDDADTDTVEIGQYITISFSSSIYTSIELQTISVGAWTTGDAGYYQIDTGSQIALSSGNNDLASSIDVLGKTLTFASTAGNGISFNGITVDAVPEPAALALLGAGSLVLLLFRRLYARQ